MISRRFEEQQDIQIRGGARRKSSINDSDAMAAGHVSLISNAILNLVSCKCFALIVP